MLRNIFRAIGRSIGLIFNGLMFPLWCTNWLMTYRARQEADAAAQAQVAHQEKEDQIARLERLLTQEVGQKPKPQRNPTKREIVLAALDARAAGKPLKAEDVARLDPEIHAWLERLSIGEAMTAKGYSYSLLMQHLHGEQAINLLPPPISTAKRAKVSREIEAVLQEADDAGFTP